MGNIYKKVINYKKNSVSNIILVTTTIAEDIAIIRKRKLYEDVVWSKQQQQEFDDYWLQNYGSKIPNMWHKLYQHYTHSYNIEYIPEKLYTTKIEPFLNPYFQAYEYQNKGILELLIAKGIKGIARCPETCVIADNNYIYDNNRKIIDKNLAKQLICEMGNVVIKPTKDSSSGKNIRFLEIVNGKDKKTGLTVEEILNFYSSGNYIVQETIKASEVLKKVYDGAINTFRVTTYIADNKIYVAPIGLRMGANGSEVDNIHAGGLVIYVDDEGRLAKEAFKLGYGTKDVRYKKHPNSGIEFDNYRIDNIPLIIEAAKAAHSCMTGLGIISWDFTLDKENVPVIIEANILGQSVWFPQIISGQGVFGEQTKLVLKKISKKNKIIL